MNHNDTVRQSFKKQAEKFTAYHMSKTRILSREEFEKMFEKDFMLQCEETTLVPVNLKSWMELTDTSKDVQKEITDLMKAELAGGRKTGFSPYCKASQIMFDHRWLLLIGVKN